MKYEALFSPIKLRGLELKNRIFLPAMMYSRINTAAANEAASTVYTGVLNIIGGNCPRRISLIQPPPTAVTVPTTTAPNISSSRRIATKVPAMENAAVPISSAAKKIISVIDILTVKLRLIVKNSDRICLALLKAFKLEYDDFVYTLNKERCR